MAAYQLEVISQIWFEQWKEKSEVYAGHFYWEIFRVVFVNICSIKPRIPEYETYNYSPLFFYGPTVHRWVSVIGLHDLGVSDCTHNLRVQRVVGHADLRFRFW